MKTFRITADAYIKYATAEVNAETIEEAEEKVYNAILGRKLEEYSTDIEIVSSKEISKEKLLNTRTIVEI